MLLSIETSLGFASVCISDGSKVISYSKEEESSKQAEKIFFHIQEVLSQANIEYKDLTHIISSVGPGSFTAIRIGMSSAKGVCIGLKLPFIGLTTLEILANKACCNQNSKGQKKVISLIDAGRGQFYSQKFYFDEGILKALVVPNSITYENIITESEGVDILISNKPNDVFDKLNEKEVIISGINAKDCANLAHQRLNNDMVDLTVNSPLYLREADAKPGKKFIWNN